MVLVNSNRTAIDTQAFEPVDMHACIKDAMTRYPFQSAGERSLVKWHPGESFSFYGSQLLMVHVLFNFLKNTLYQLARAQKSHISIWCECGGTDGMNTLHFQDTGPGIRATVLPFIFDRFYSGMPRGQGTGIGLAFVKVVIGRFGGDTRCQSIEGEYTDFIIRLPRADGHEPL